MEELNFIYWVISLSEEKMKEILKIIVVSVFVILQFSPVFATDEQNLNVIGTISMEEYTQMFPLKSGRTGNGYSSVSTLVNAYTDAFTSVGYHPLTTSWSKASSYTVGASKTYSASASKVYYGVNLTVTASQTTSLSITYPADGNRFSKLFLSADISVKKFRIDQYYYGTYQSTYYIVSATPINTYVWVKYQ